MSKEDEDRFVMVTMVSSHRMRYCIPVSELQKMNEEKEMTAEDALDWAQDSVTMEEVDEFSQHWLGEQTVDAFILDKERVLQMFDRDNDYLKDWSEEQKLDHIYKWKVNSRV